MPKIKTNSGSKKKIYSYRIRKNQKKTRFS